MPNSVSSDSCARRCSVFSPSSPSFWESPVTRISAVRDLRATLRGLGRWSISRIDDLGLVHLGQLGDDPGSGVPSPQLGEQALDGGLRQLVAGLDQVLERLLLVLGREASPPSWRGPPRRPASTPRRGSAPSAMRLRYPPAAPRPRPSLESVACPVPGLVLLELAGTRPGRSTTCTGLGDPGVEAIELLLEVFRAPSAPPPGDGPSRRRSFPGRLRASPSVRHRSVLR